MKPEEIPTPDAVHPDWRKAAMDWVKQNAPGGWIDDLRVKVAALERRAAIAESALTSADREIERLRIVAAASDTASEDFELRQQVKELREMLARFLAPLDIANGNLGNALASTRKIEDEARALLARTKPTHQPE